MESSSTKRMVVGKRRGEGIAQFMSLKPIYFFEDVLSVVLYNLMFRSNQYQCTFLNDYIPKDMQQVCSAWNIIG